MSAKAASRAPLIDRPLEWVLFGTSLLVVVAAALLEVKDGVQVVVPWLQQPLPEVCMFRRVLGTSCPGCGLTRSFISLAHGRWLESWHYHPAGPLLFMAVALQIPLRAIRLWQIRRGGRLLAVTGANVVLWIAVVVILLTGLVRVFHERPFASKLNQSDIIVISSETAYWVEIDFLGCK